MAFKLDFEDMRRRSEEERAMDPIARGELEARREFGRSARLVVDDDDMRASASLELRTITLAADPDVRFGQNYRDVTNEKSHGALLRMIDFEDGRPFDGEDANGLRRTLYYPSEAERLAEQKDGGEGLDRHVEGLESGSVVSMLGREVPRRWKDRDDRWHTVMEFHAMRMGHGVLTRDELVAGKPEMVAAARAYERAESDQAREAVARRFLGQEQVVAAAEPERAGNSAGARAAMPTKGPSSGVSIDEAAVAMDRSGRGR